MHFGTSGVWRIGLVMLLVLANPCVAQTADPFQSNPGPVPPARPLPRITRPAPEPAMPQPIAPAPSAVPVGVAVFNGTYKGGAPGSPQCDNGTTEEVDVFQGRVSGTGYNNRQQYWKVEGTVSADGSFTGTHGPSILTGKFQNGVFEGTYLSTGARCGRRTLTLRRDPPR